MFPKQNAFKKDLEFGKWDLLGRTLELLDCLLSFL
jgi:hypothetical protein